MSNAFSVPTTSSSRPHPIVGDVAAATLFWLFLWPLIICGCGCRRHKVQIFSSWELNGLKTHTQRWMRDVKGQVGAAFDRFLRLT
jgi:hypothetical protein